METCASCLVTKNKVQVKVKKVEILLGLTTFSLALDCSVYTVAVLMHQVTLRRSFFYRKKKTQRNKMFRSVLCSFQKVIRAIMRG